jgi:hypothetical protein
LYNELTQKVVQKIFPAGSEITKNPLEVSPEDRFWLIPGQNGPRWLIPQEKKYGLSMFQQWRPYNYTSRIKWKIIYMAYYTGRLGLIPGVKSIGIAKDSKKAWSHIHWDRESVPIPIIYFGTPCSTHKAVAVIVDSFKMQPSIICKVPLSDLAAKSIKQEYNILCYLKQNNPGVAPIPFFLDRESGAAVQEAIIGSPLPRTFSGLHWKFLEQLAISDNATSVFEHSQSLLNLLSKIDRLESKTKILLERLLKECRDSTSLPQIFVHGDFAPWNIKKIDNGSLMALDWEMGDPNGLPVYDFFYFFIIQAYLFKDKFNLNRIFKLLPEYSKKYPLLQILKFTAVSLGFRLSKEEQNTEYLENFLRNINL